MSDKITYDDKVGVKPKTVQINQVWDDDMNEIKNKHNNVDDRVTAIEASGVVGVTPIDVSAEWSSGLSFDVTADNYPVLNTFYSSTPGVVTLDAADATLDRIDLIVAIAPVSPSTVGTVGFIKGDPATTTLVVPPDYDPSLVYVIKQVIVRAAASIPEDTATQLVFDENVGTPTEFAFTSNSANIVASTNDAFSGLVSIEGTNPVIEDKSKFTRVSTESTSKVGLLTFYIKLKADFTTSYIYVKFFNGTTLVGSPYTFKGGDNGFDATSLDWQKISIDASKLNLPISDYDIIEIYPYKSFSGYFIDLIQTHEGSGSDIIDGIVLTESDLDITVQRYDANTVKDDEVTTFTKILTVGSDSGFVFNPSNNEMKVGGQSGFSKQGAALWIGTGFNDAVLRPGASNVLTVKSTGAVAFEPTTTPAAPAAGHVYYDSGTNKLRCYNGTAWFDLF